MRRRKRTIKTGGVLVKSQSQIEGIRASGRINTAVLDYVEQHICAGISTEQIDRWVYDVTTGMGAVPAPLHFEGFPKSVCTSGGLPRDTQREDDPERRRYYQCGRVHHIQGILFRRFSYVLHRFGKPG